MRLLLLFLASTLVTAASAQTTWQNLQFGQSPDNVRSQLTAHNLEVQTNPDGTLQSSSDFELSLPGLKNTLPMVASFHFSTAAALSDITLSLDLPAMKRYWAAIGPDAALSSFASDKISAALSGKYGTPLYHSPSCDAGAKLPGTCTTLWHAANQTIELERLTTSHGPHLIIRYQPLVADL